MTSAPTMPASGSIHSQPKARASIRPTMTSTETAASAIDMDDGGAHVVVARRRAMRVLVLLEDDGMRLAADRDDAP